MATANRVHKQVSTHPATVTLLKGAAVIGGVLALLELVNMMQSKGVKVRL